MKEINDLRAILDEECKVLVKKGQMMPSIKSPWRYYSSPIEEESETDHLRAVLEAGKWLLIAEKDYELNDLNKVWVSLATSQAALLKSLTTKGKKEARRIGNKKGGEIRNASIKHSILCIADKLIEDNNDFRGLAKKVATELMDNGIPMSVDAVLKVLKKYQNELK